MGFICEKYSNRGKLLCKNRYNKKQRQRFTGEKKDLKRRCYKNKKLYRTNIQVTNTYESSSFIPELDPDLLEKSLESLESEVRCEKTSLITRWQELVKYQQNFEQSYNSMRFYLWFIDRYGKDKESWKDCFIFKMGSTKECSNYESIALSSHASKIIFHIFQSKCYQYMDCVQAGFRKGKDA